MNFYKFGLDEKKVVGKTTTNEWVSLTPAIDGNLIFFGNDGGFFTVLTKQQWQQNGSLRQMPVFEQNPL
ncbi:hypothetical protein ACQ9BO_10490 [Flavobacterium sp. P21]|uniref:hypothetical protein n=1 Tax=Flavobacterium sp. P21 TaxID=3423948 RepID=UPI003D67A156